MTSHSTLKLAAALALGVLGMASAHARSDVHFSIGVHAPLPVYTQPVPVYTPRPVYVQPAPVYVQPAPLYHGQPHHGGYWEYQRYGRWGDHDRDGIANIHDRDHPRNRARPHGRHDGRGDWDRDGVPNRYDRQPGNPYYR